MRAAGAFFAGFGDPKSAGLQLRFRMYFPRDPAGILRKRACGAKMLLHFTPPPGGDKGELARLRSLRSLGSLARGTSFDKRA